MKLLIYFILFTKIFPESILEFNLENESVILEKFETCAESCEKEANWVLKKEFKNIGFLKFRKKFILRSFDETKSYSINLGVISDKDEVWFNDKLIGSCGNFLETKPECYDKNRIYEIPSRYFLKNQMNKIQISVKGYFPNEMGLMNEEIKISETKIIHKEFYKTEIFKLVFLSVYFTVSFYFLFMYSFRTKDKDYLLFSVFILSVILYQFLRTQIKYSLNFNFVLSKQIEYFVFTLMLPLFVNFIRVYFKIEANFKIKFLSLISFLTSISFFVHENIILFDDINKKFVQPIGLIWLIKLFYYLYKAKKKSHPDFKYLISSITLLFVSLLTDILSDRGFFEFPRTFGFSFLAFILSIAMILAHKFVRLNDEVEELNLSLEKKVIERTEELNKSLFKIAEVKKQQDGDYYLTSLLLNPLTRNKNHSELIKTEIYSKQKKVFEFKNKFHEIGGDISITTNIELNEKKYLVFVNADAMGKSIQGAGGALVMGVVFNTVLTRSNIATFKNRSPERWLKDTFLELQKVFESFDGTMFISCVIGLIDEETGFLYYLNAEHPWTVLYRDKKASFIEKEHNTRKLGIFENENLFYVKTLELKPGDILIAGSDGRDDVMIGISDELRIINEDEYLFLQTVENSNANLEKISENLKLSGEITDDLSLVRIEYIGQAISQSKKNFTEAVSKIFPTYFDLRDSDFKENILFMKSIYKINPNNEVANKQLSFYYFKKREFQLAIKHISNYNKKKPDSLDMLYLESISNKKCGNYDRAIDIGEQIFIREPNHLKNLKNLKELYTILNKQERIKDLELKLKKL